MFVDANGVSFHVLIDGSGPDVLLLHGFSGSTAGWNRLVLDLSHAFRFIRIDLIGHGRTESPPDPTRYSMDHGVRDLVALLNHFGVQQCGLLGYSMGARLALHLALSVPERIERLMLESGTYGIASLTSRTQRVHDDELLADWIEAHGVEAFTKRWEALPLFASQQSLPADVLEHQRRDRLTQTPRGLANSLRGMGTGTQRCLRDHLEQITMPTFLVCGDLDEKFTHIAREMHALIPRAELAVIPRAGHNVHLEQPRQFADHVWRFFSPGKSGDGVEP